MLLNPGILLEGELKRREVIPFQMSTTIQSVVIGDAVFVGGGDTNSEYSSCTIMKFDLQQDEWTTLPQYSAKWFAMTSLNNQLLLVGGYNIGIQKSTNQIAMFVVESAAFQYPYPPMKIARHSSTAVHFFNYIIVAGGSSDQGFVSFVEVLDIVSRQWYFAQSLPRPQSELKSALIGYTLYLMGGWDKAVHKVGLNELISSAVQNQPMPTLWEVIEDTPLSYSAPLNVRSLLYAVGGYNYGNPNSSIYVYQPDTRRWVKVGDLPTARWFCTCSVLPSGEVIVAGGQTNLSRSFYCNTANFLLFQ